MNNMEEYRKAYEHLLYAYALLVDAGCDSVILSSLNYVLKEVAKKLESAA